MLKEPTEFSICNDRYSFGQGPQAESHAGMLSKNFEERCPLYRYREGGSYFWKEVMRQTEKETKAELRDRIEIQ